MPMNLWKDCLKLRQRKVYTGVRCTQGDDSSLSVCSASCTVHLQLFTNIDIL